MTFEAAILGLTTYVVGMVVGAGIAFAVAISVWRKSCNHNGVMMRGIVKSTQAKAAATNNASSLYGFGFADGLDLGRKIVEGMGTTSGRAELDVGIVDGDVNVQVKQ